MRNQRRRPSFVLVLVIILSAVTMHASFVAGQPRHARLYENPNVPLRAWLLLARAHFDAVENARYRTEMFALVRETYGMKPKQLLEALDAVLDEGERSAIDGLEGLAMAYADGIAREGDAAQLAALRQRLSAARTKIRYRWNHPWPLLLVPIGRPGSRLFFNVRADMARVMFQQLLLGNGLRIDELFAVGTIQESICRLPQLGNDLAQLEGLNAAEERRKRKCDEMRAGGGGSMTGQQALDVASASACLDSWVEELRTGDEYTADEMTADMAQCSADLAAWTGTGTPLGMSAVAQAALIAAAGQVGHYIGEAGLKLLDHLLAERAKQNDYDRKREEAAREALIQELRRQQGAADAKRQEAARALGHLVEAVGKVETAEQRVKEAEAVVAQKQEALDRAERDTLAAKRAVDACDLPGSCNDDQKNTARTAWEDAKKREDAARGEKTAAESELTKANEHQRQANSELSQAQGEVTTAGAKTRDPIDPNTSFQSEACNRLITNGRISDLADVHETLPADWRSFTSRWRDVIRPVPDGKGQPAEVLALPGCGSDPATSNWAGRSCNKPVYCADESKQCGCGLNPSESESVAERLAASLNRAACAMVHCPQGQQAKPLPGTAICDCASGEGGEGPRPSPPRLLIGPASVFLRETPMSPSEYRSHPLDAIGVMVSDR